MIMSVFNNSGAALNRGQIVRQTGISYPSQLPSVALASANNSIQSKVFGIIVDDLADDTAGTVVISGSFKPFDTSSYGLNDPIYLSNAGTMAATPGTVSVVVGKALTISAQGCAFIGSFYASVPNCC